MLKGIDVSYAQDNIDFTKINKSQVKFAIIRASYGWENNQKDNQFERNYSNFKKLGIPIGVYHYSYARNKEQAIKEAKYCIECIKGKTFELPIYIDIEDNSVISSGKRNLTDVVKYFCDYIESQGYKAGFYTNLNWLNNYLYKDELMDRYSLWLAQWESQEPYYQCDIWQYKVGKSNTIDGIYGEIDLNCLYNDSLLNIPNKSADNTINTFANDTSKFLQQAKKYIGKNGSYVCIDKLHIGTIYDWCAYAVSAIMNDCGFIGKYIKQIEGGAGSIARESDGTYGTWFKKGNNQPQIGDLIFFRYGGNYTDNYHADHVGIVESVNDDEIITLEGNVDGNSDNWATSSTFKRKTRFLSNDNVYAFYRPNWCIDTVKSKDESKTNKIFKVSITAIDGLNIRMGAGLNYKIIGGIPYGEIVTVSNQIQGKDYLWGYIKYGNINGWIALKYTKTFISFSKGDKVKVKYKSKQYGTNIYLSNWVYETNFDVIESKNDRIVIGINGNVTAAVNRNDLILL